MADIKISALPDGGSTVTSADILPIVQSGQTKRATLSQAVAAGVAALLPWMIDIDALNMPAANTNWQNRVVNPSMYYNAAWYSTGAQNAEISWPVVLAAGTWSFALVYDQGTDRGVISVQLDSVEKGTIDGYYGSTAYNSLTVLTGIAVSTTEKKTLKLKMTTKNGSSSSYVGSISHIRLIRTA